MRSMNVIVEGSKLLHDPKSQHLLNAYYTPGVLVSMSHNHLTESLRRPYGQVPSHLWFTEIFSTLSFQSGLGIKSGWEGSRAQERERQGTSHPNPTIKCTRLWCKAHDPTSPCLHFLASKMRIRIHSPLEQTDGSVTGSCFQHPQASQVTQW